jgi:hypothetical protein
MPPQTSVTCYRSDRGNVPAINVKVQLVRAHPNLEKMLDSTGKMLRVRQEAFELAQEQWWRDAEEIGHEVFGPKVEVGSEGRSGGWLIVIGLGDPILWNRKDITRWKRFEKRILSMLAPKEITARYSTEIENLLTENA